MTPDYAYLKGKRLAGLDYGRKRVGFAICDEFHITVSPRRVFDFTSASFFDDLINALKDEKVYAVVLGIPLRTDNEETEIIREIKQLKSDLESKIGIEVILHDEAFSSIRATETMIAIGKKKKKRSQKSSKDLIAAAIILRDFLDTIC